MAEPVSDEPPSNPYASPVAVGSESPWRRPVVTPQLTLFNLGCIALMMVTIYDMARGYEGAGTVLEGAIRVLPVSPVGAVYFAALACIGVYGVFAWQLWHAPSPKLVNLCGVFMAAQMVLMIPGYDLQIWDFGMRVGLLWLWPSVNRSIHFWWLKQQRQPPSASERPQSGLRTTI